jgi:hypothetical protein
VPSHSEPRGWAEKRALGGSPAALNEGLTARRRSCFLPAMGLIAFYEGNMCTMNMIQVVEDNPGQDFQPVQNDAIRSLKLHGVRPGAEIRLYDSPDGSTSDDFCIINVKRSIPEYVVPSLERTYEDEYVRVMFIRNNGLDGQVSRIRIN